MSPRANQPRRTSIVALAETVGGGDYVEVRKINVDEVKGKKKRKVGNIIIIYYY